MPPTPPAQPDGPAHDSSLVRIGAVAGWLISLERIVHDAKGNSLNSPDTDKRFTGSIPKLYEEYLVPLIFEPYAVDLVNRVASQPLTRVLEIAAGTGVVTRKLASVLPESVYVVATDLNQAMLDLASAVGTTRNVEWRQADAMQLPFEDSVFDAVVCQFGVMFFPEKSKAFSEARRVLRPGGVFMFNVWDENFERFIPGKRLGWGCVGIDGAA